LQSQKIVHHHYTNICLQGFVVEKKIYHEGNDSVKERSYFLLLHFYMFSIMEFLDKIRKILCLLAECLSIAIGRWDDPVQHSEMPNFNN